MQAGGAGNGGGGGMQRQGGAACNDTRPPKASAERVCGAACTAADGGRPAEAATEGDAVGDDGFQTVRRRGWRRARDLQPHGDDADACDAGGPRREHSAGADTQREGDDGGGVEEGGEAPPTPNTLHRAWQDEVAVVRRLRKQGIAQGHPAMQAACAARDSAERTWRGAKDPAPAAVRLARAQAKLDRAIDIQSESRQALIEYGEAHRRKLAELHARLDEDKARVRHRRQQLEAVQEEVGAEGLGARTRARQSEAVRRVHSSLCGTVAPTIAALVEQLDSSTPAWTVLNGLLGTLSESKSTLEGAFSATPGTQRYDIADGAGADGEEGEWEEDWEEGSQWSESHDLHANATGARSDARGSAAAAAATPMATAPSGQAGASSASG